MELLTPILQEFIRRQQSPSFWLTLIADSEEAHTHTMKLELHMTAAAHFTTAKAAV